MLTKFKINKIEVHIIEHLNHEEYLKSCCFKSFMFVIEVLFEIFFSTKYSIYQLIMWSTNYHILSTKNIGKLKQKILFIFVI